MSNRAASDSYKSHRGDSEHSDPDLPREPGAALALQEEERAHAANGGHETKSLNSLAISATTHCLTG
ncbi:MAG: hypothetical protein M3377_10195, partial [Actinomycetota bacterium]|nr:hypothetical protein [Actinomycetota bacterium]